MEELYQLMREYKVAEAFRSLLPDIHCNDEKQALFLEILRTDWNLFVIAQEPDLLSALEDGRKERDGWLSYGYARYMDCIRPHEAAIYHAEEAYDIAIDCGIWDAIMYKANAWLYGEYLDMDKSEERYIQLRDMAAKRGSVYAREQQLLDRTFGRHGYDKPEPLEAYKLLEPFINECVERKLHIDAGYYRIIGYIAEELGRKLEADMWYKRAIGAGDKKAFFALALIRACGKDYRIVDREEFERIMQLGCEAQAPDTYYSPCYYIEHEEFETMDAEAQKALHERIRAGLEKAIEAGDDTAAYFLASYYRDGTLGFETDCEKAYEYALLGAKKRNKECKELADEIGDMLDTWDEGDDGRYDAWA